MNGVAGGRPRWRGRGRRVLGAGAVLGAGLGLWGWQASVHETRVAALREQVEALEMEKERISVAARKRAELEKELTSLERDLVRLRPLLPEAFDVPAFVEGVQRRYGVEALVVEERRGESGAFLSREVSVVLFGDRAATRKVPETGRFVRDLPVFWWKLEEEHDADAEGVFTLFALPRSAAVTTGSPGAGRAGATELAAGSWLWPYARKEAELVAKREALRVEVGRDEVLRGRIHLFEARKAELQACVDALNILLREPEGSPAEP